MKHIIVPENSSKWIGDARNALTSISVIINDGTSSVENLTSFQFFASGTCQYFFNSWQLDVARAGIQGVCGRV